MKIYTEKLKVESKSQIEFIDITSDVMEIVKKAGIKEGMLNVFSPHTTAAVCINQNEPLLIQDFQRLLYRIAPIDERYSHDLFELKKGSASDGRSNGHSHAKNIILGVNMQLPVSKGQAILGERQSLFLVELDGGRLRHYWVQVMGE